MKSSPAQCALIFMVFAGIEEVRGSCLRIVDHDVKQVESRGHEVRFNIKFHNTCSYGAYARLKVWVYTESGRLRGRYGTQDTLPLEPRAVRWHCGKSPVEKSGCQFSVPGTTLKLRTQDPLVVRWGFTTCRVGKPCGEPADPGLFGFIGGK